MNNTRSVVGTPSRGGVFSARPAHASVMRLLEDEEWGKWSDREIARRCGVDDKTVGKYRREVTAENPQLDADRTYTTKHGTKATMNTANIGSKPITDDEWEQWSDREIARRCGVDHKTVGRLRDDLSGEIPQIPITRKVSRNGMTYTQNTANIGGSKPVDDGRELSTQVGFDDVEGVEHVSVEKKSVSDTLIVYKTAHSGLFADCR